MIAYIERTAGKSFTLVICSAPCNGPTYANAPRIPVASKRETNTYCKAKGIKPWNF